MFITAYGDEDAVPIRSRNVFRLREVSNG